MKVTTEEYSEYLQRKLKRERNSACLNCQRYVECNEIARYEICGHFEEIEGEAWVITKIG